MEYGKETNRLPDTQQQVWTSSEIPQKPISDDLFVRYFTVRYQLQALVHGAYANWKKRTLTSEYGLRPSMDVRIISAEKSLPGKW